MYHLDALVWQSGWQKAPSETREPAEHELVAEPAWVIDGVSSIVRGAADLVIFLDVPRSVCAWRGLRRCVRYNLRTRPEMPADCPEWRILPRLLRIIHRFPEGAGRAIREEAAVDPERFEIIRQPETAQALVRGRARQQPSESPDRLHAWKGGS